MTKYDKILARARQDSFTISKLREKFPELWGRVVKKQITVKQAIEFAMVGKK